jgi:hypothetical protein
MQSPWNGFRNRIAPILRLHRELIRIGKVWSLRDALSLQHTLDLAGIRFSWGRKKLPARIR